MVLSHKKLKQKLREAKAESLTANEFSELISKKSAVTPAGNLRLQELLDAAKQKNRLIKREKRKRSLSARKSGSGHADVTGNVDENKPIEKKDSEGEDDGGKKKRKEKKRKTDDGDENKSIKKEEDLQGEDDRGDGSVKKKRKERKRKREDGDEDKSIKKEKDLQGEDDHGDGSVKQKKRKERKRKREDGESEEKGLVDDGKMNEAKKPKKPKKKKKKKHKNKKAAKTVEEKVEVEAEEVNHETEHISQSLTHEDAATKIYAGGIPYYSTEDDIRSYFEGCGTVTEVDCMKFPDSGKFRGIAIIRFKTEAAAKRALALDGSDMGGFYLKIQPYQSKRTKPIPKIAEGYNIVDGYNRIYVGNLSWDITEDDLKTFFSDCNIASIRWGMDKETGEFRGFGHVDFSDSGSLLKALKLDQQIVCGRPIKISYAVPLKGAKTNATITENHFDGLDTNVASPTVEPKEAENGGSTAVSGKIRRRTCYECGEKGHLSTACPKKQNAETNTDAS